MFMRVLKKPAESIKDGGFFLTEWNVLRQVRVEQGEAILHSYLPELHLGSRCTNELTLSKSVVEGRVRRSSHLEATAGVTIYNR